MNKFLILLPAAAALTGCASHRTAPEMPAQERPRMAREAEAEEYSPRTLIIFYDAEVGKAPLLKAVKRLKAEVMYDYKNFNGIAIALPEGSDIHEAMRQLQQVKGVLQVNRDRIMRLD